MSTIFTKPTIAGLKRRKPESHFVSEITPELAAQLLALSRGNRTMRKWHVDELAEAMSRGEWRPVTDQGIGFDVEGHLYNGHHRLTAVVQSGVTIGSLVILGVPKNVYEITDDVMRRKLDERTGQPKFLAEVSNRACRYIFPYKRYPADVINRVCASKFGEMATLLQQHCNTNRAVVTTATVRTAVIARMLEATTTEDLKYILDQYRALATNSSHYSECIAAFNRRCERSRGVDTSSGASLAYAYMHFNPAYASRQKLPPFDQEEEINKIRKTLREAVLDPFELIE